MKNIKVLKRIFAVVLAAMMVVFAAGCGEKDQPTVSDLQAKAAALSKPEAEKTYKKIVNLINERADLIPHFMEEEKDHTTLTFDEDTYNDVLTAREAVKAAKNISEMASARKEMDTAIYNWVMKTHSLNPKATDAHYLALRKKINETSEEFSSLVSQYNKLVKTYNETASKERKMEEFSLTASDSAKDEK